MTKEEKKIDPPHWWLSFADDTGFLGGCVVKADSMMNAIRATHVLRINPGGSVQGTFMENGPGSFPLGKLLSASEINSFDEALRAQSAEGGASRA